MSDEAKDFHAHLNVCPRCAKQPFNLCATGARLIQEAASKIAATGFNPFSRLSDKEEAK